MKAFTLAATRFGGILCATAAVLALALPARAQPQLYWSQYVYDSPVDRFSLHRSNLDGTQPVELNHGVAPEPYLGLAAYDGKLFWGSSDTNAIHAATVTGEELGQWDGPLPPAVRAEAMGMAYDAATGATYRAGQVAGGERNIERVDAAGNVTTLIETDLFPSNLALALDAVHGKLYFGGRVDGSGGSIRRANLDGTGVEFVLATLPIGSHPFDLALDPLGGKMYWTIDSLAGQGGIRRADLDGGNIDDLVNGAPVGVLALDVVVPEPATGLVMSLVGAMVLARPGRPQRLHQRRGGQSRID
jgi:hypothetical protein